MTTSIEFGEEAKAIAGAIKHMCSCCKTLPFSFKNDGNVMVIAQQTDNKLAWIELEIFLNSPPVKCSSPFYVVESKILINAMRKITTLRHTLTFDFGDKELKIEAADEVFVCPYLLEKPFLLDTSPCSGSSVIAGLLNTPTKDVENMFKDSSGVTDTVKFEICDDRVSIAGQVIEAMTITKSVPYSMMFDSATIASHVKNTLAPNISIQLYEDLPIKILYCLLQKLKGKKKTSLGAKQNATMQIYISPRT